jgi:hypothetical protein
VRLRCPDVSDDMCEHGVPGGALNRSSTSYPDHGHYRDLPLQGKIPMAEPGIEPATSQLAVRSSDHQATKDGLTTLIYFVTISQFSFQMAVENQN